MASDEEGWFFVQFQTAAAQLVESLSIVKVCSPYFLHRYITEDDCTHDTDSYWITGKLMYYGIHSDILFLAFATRKLFETFRSEIWR